VRGMREMTNRSIKKFAYIFIISLVTVLAIELLCHAILIFGAI